MESTGQASLGGSERGRLAGARPLGVVQPRGGPPRFDPPRIKKPLVQNTRGFKNPAIPTFTLVCTIIGSESLTSVFGMGTGVTFLIWSPERRPAGYFARPVADCLVEVIVEASGPFWNGSKASARYRWSSLRPLVLVSLTRYRAYTSSLST